MTDRVFERNSQMEAGHDVDVNKVLGLDALGGLRVARAARVRRATTVKSKLQCEVRKTDFEHRSRRHAGDVGRRRG